jgi:hypothetical protein
MAADSLARRVRDAESKAPCSSLLCSFAPRWAHSQILALVPHRKHSGRLNPGTGTRGTPMIL